MMNEVLILGGSYFIGRQITEQCLDMGAAVTLLNRGSRPWTGRPISQLIADRLDSLQMKTALQGKRFDIVIDVSGLDRRQVENVCQSLEYPPSQWLFISSSAVYDIDHCTLPILETGPLGENLYWGKYGTDKIAAEKAACDYCRRHGISLSILRPPYMYGEYNYVQRESFVFSHLTAGQPILIPARDCHIQFCYTRDLAVIVTELIRLNVPGTQIYNVGNRRAVTFSEWIQSCAEVCGMHAEIIPVHDLKWNARDYFPFRDYDNVLDVTRIHQIVTEDTPFETGLRRAYHWFCENRGEIVFKPELAANELQILKEMKNQ